MTGDTEKMFDVPEEKKPAKNGEEPKDYWVGDKEGLDYEAVSAWLKCMRLGAVDEAFFWASVVFEKGGRALLPYMGRRLGEFGVEDAYGPEAAHMGQVYEALCKAGHWQAVWTGTEYMCRAPKWWESEEGRDFDRRWQESLKKAKEAVASGQLRYPSFALDVHTRMGQAVQRKYGEHDDRYSGTWEGRAFHSGQFLRLGHLDRNDWGDRHVLNLTPSDVTKDKHGRRAMKASMKVRPLGGATYVVNSETSPDTTYMVAKDVESGEWECSCPAFTKGLKNPCKHIEAVRHYREHAEGGGADATSTE